MELSILKSVKEALDVPPDYPPLDNTLIMYINGVFVALNTLGVGPEDGFRITDGDTEWNTYINGGKNLNNIQTYMCLKVKLLFDGNLPGPVIAAIEREIEKLEYLITLRRDNAAWTIPVQLSP